MSDSLRTSSTQTGPAAAAGAEGVDREARIEQLLLAGLDQYFAGQYEQAIDIWTRVAFLERRHGRARAYIDRARSALAERQRESEELLHRGVAEYHAGRLQSARELLTRAVEQGGPSDTALVFLQHLGRVDPFGRPRVDGEHGRAVEPASVPSHREPSSPGRLGLAVDARANARTGWILTVVVSAAIAVTILVASRPLVSLLAELPVAGPNVTPAAEPLPIVRTSDVQLERARQLHAAGRSREALAVLEAVDLADPARDEADRLRTEVQRVLLADVTPPIDASSAGGTR